MATPELSAKLARRLEAAGEVEEPIAVASPPPPPFIPRKVVENPYVANVDLNIDDLIMKTLREKERRQEENNNSLSPPTAAVKAASTTSTAKVADPRSPPPKTSIRELLEREYSNNSAATAAISKTPVVQLEHHQKTPKKDPSPEYDSSELERKLAAQRMRKTYNESSNLIYTNVVDAPLPVPLKPLRHVKAAALVKTQESIEDETRANDEVEEQKTFEILEQEVEERSRSNEFLAVAGTSGSVNVPPPVPCFPPPPPPPPPISSAKSDFEDECNFPPPPSFAPPPAPSPKALLLQHPPPPPLEPPPPNPMTPTLAPPAPTEKPRDLTPPSSAAEPSSSIRASPPPPPPPKMAPSTPTSKRIPCLAMPTPFVPTPELVAMIRREEGVRSPPPPPKPKRSDSPTSSRPQSPAVPKKLLSPLGLMCDPNFAVEKSPTSPPPPVTPPKKPLDDDAELASLLERRTKILEGECVPLKLNQKLSLYAEFPEFSRKQIKFFTETFKKFDEDADNFIDFMELKRMMEKLGEAQTHIALKDLIKKVDEDKDGKVSQREFLLIFRLAAKGELDCSEVFRTLADSVDVTKEGVLGAANFFQAKIEEQTKKSRFEEEMREEQEERKREEAEKKERRDKFLASKSIFH